MSASAPGTKRRPPVRSASSSRPTSSGPSPQCRRALGKDRRGWGYCRWPKSICACPIGVVSGAWWWGGGGRPTPAHAAVDRHLSGVGLYPTAGRELHPRGPPVGRHGPVQGPTQIGTLGTHSVDASPQPSPHVTNPIPPDTAPSSRVRTHADATPNCRLSRRPPLSSISATPLSDS